MPTRLPALLALAASLIVAACGALETDPASPPADAGTDAAQTGADGARDDGAGDDVEGVEVQRVEGESVGGEGVEVVVERVIDGDSLELLVDGVEVEVRLLGINAPELYTPGDVASCNGAAARNQLGSFLDGGELRFRPDEEDRFGRLLGVVDVDGVPVTMSMVDAGWALALWSAEDESMTASMEAAAAEERGMWGGTCGAPSVAGLAITEARLDAPGDDRQNLNEEWVSVTNEGDAAVDLDGWTVRDETTSNRFLIAGQALEVGATVRFRSGSGSNGGGDYFLGESFPVWSNRGETVLLLDPEGRIAAHAFVQG